MHSLPGLTRRIGFLAIYLSSASMAAAGITLTGQSRTIEIQALPGLIPLQTDTAALNVPFVQTLTKTASDNFGITEIVTAQQNSSFVLGTNSLSVVATGSGDESGTFETGISDGKSALSLSFVLDTAESFHVVGSETTNSSGFQDDFVQLRLKGPGGDVFNSISNNLNVAPALNMSGVLPAGAYVLTASATAGGGGGNEGAAFSMNLSVGQTTAVPLPSASLMGLTVLLPLGLGLSMLRRRLRN